jgi:uncharacterized protein YndB with AHSA1/START domain
MSATTHVSTPSDLEIAITRTFDAPRQLVFDAISQPEFLKRWLLGPPGWEMTVCESELRVGGKFRHEWRGPGDAKLAMFGEYREVVPPERIVRTECFDIGCAGQAGEQLGTLLLTEEGGKTTLKLTLHFPSKEARDATIASGMEQGVAAGHARLDELLQELIAQSAE